jgi:hypothetical protein
VALLAQASGLLLQPLRRDGGKGCLAQRATLASDSPPTLPRRELGVLAGSGDGAAPATHHRRLPRPPGARRLPPDVVEPVEARFPPLARPGRAGTRGFHPPLAGRLRTGRPGNPAWPGQSAAGSRPLRRASCTFHITPSRSLRSWATAGEGRDCGGT